MFGYRFQNGGFTRTVWSDEGQYFSFFDSDIYVMDQTAAVVAHRKILGFKVMFHIMPPYFCGA